MTKQDVAIIIPSLNPDEKFNNVVDGMINAGFKRIILVDDGSDKEHQKPFADAMNHPECSIIVHPVNQGKGRALIDAFTYVSSKLPDLLGVITVDGDGQHTAFDASRLAEALVLTPEKVIIGCRDFSAKGIPFHNRFGNKITSAVFKSLVGMKLSDTQTGLRAYPMKYLKDFAQDVEGDRYEYESNVLMYMHDHDIPYREVAIQTLYIDDNKSSHFKVFSDSFKIYKPILKRAKPVKFFKSSLLATLIDLALYTLLNYLFKDIRYLWIQSFAAISIARIISATTNYLVNRNYVFNSKAKVSKSAVRYIILACIQMLLSWLGTTVLISHLGVTGVRRTLIKLCVDLVLFIISFNIQKYWVFKNESKKSNS